MTYRRIITGETRHSALDLQGDDLNELIGVIKYTLPHEGGVVTLSGNDTNESNRFQRVRYADDLSFVARDKTTGFFIKGTDAKAATAQYETMNYLHDLLKLRKDLGVSAVRHAFMLVPNHEWLPTISVVEPAEGETLRLADLKYLRDADECMIDEFLENYDGHIATVTQRLDKVLPLKTRRILTSDLNKGNVLVSGEDAFTIIDQPHPEYVDRALQLFEQRSLPWFKKLFTR